MLEVADAAEAGEFVCSRKQSPRQHPRKQKPHL